LECDDSLTPSPTPSGKLTSLLISAAAAAAAEPSVIKIKQK
jgi:hypothetical protein